MPTKLVFSPTLLTSSLSRVVVVGKLKDINAYVSNSGLEFVSDVAQDVLGKMVPSCLDALSPSSFSGSSNSVTVPSASSSSALPFTRFCFLAAPDAATRYNCVVRPDAITRDIKGFLSREFPSSECEEAAIQVVCVLPPSDHATSSTRAMALAYAAAIGKALPNYTRKFNKTATASGVTVHVAFASYGAEEADRLPSKEQYANMAIVVESVRKCAALVDAPCNEIYTDTLAQEARSLVADLPVEVEEIVGEDLLAAGLGGLYGVGKAAEHPPRLLILKYTPGGSKTYAWCGKGIVYDTGGLSIKTKTGMPGMKRDMGGAAAVLNAFVAYVRMGFKDNLYCLLAIAENAVGPKATRPDDIHVMYSGKTVEINNTDAEGRLVLGDAVAYAADKFSPDVLVDMCTLTGAQGVATGKLHAGVVCSDEAFESKTVHAGRSSGELVHPLMWCPELFSNEFKSSVADMKNSVANRSNAQVSCAAQFIGNHLPSDYTSRGVWLHVDMAAPAHAGERATGYGVVLLSQLFALNL